MTIAEVLRAAASRVREGWCQGQMWDHKGNACAYGAIEEVEGYLFFADEPARFAEQALGLPSRSGGLAPLAYWNDAPGQTAEGVATGLEYAALLWEQEQAQSALSSDTRLLQDA